MDELETSFFMNSETQTWRQGLRRVSGQISKTHFTVDHSHCGDRSLGSVEYPVFHKTVVWGSL